MIEGLWCLAPDAVPLWYLIENDRRITNEVPELQYFLKETHAFAGRRIWRGEARRALRLGTPVTLIEHAAKACGSCGRRGVRGGQA